MSIFYGQYETVPCDVCLTDMEIAASELIDRKQYDQDMVFICYLCRQKYGWIMCDCGAAHTSFPQFHYHWCNRNNMDASKEVVHRIRKYRAKDNAGLDDTN